MSLDLKRLKIYNFQVDELRPATTDAQKQEWLKRLENQAGVRDFKIQSDMELFDTCCGGSADDCGAVL